MFGSGVAPLQAHGAYEDLVAELELKIAEHPADAALHFRLAEAHVGHEEWRRCLLEIEIVEKLAPGVHPVGYLRGLSLHLGGKDEAARKALDEFLTANPEHAKALATRSEVLAKLGQSEAAVSDARAAIQSTESPDPEAYEQLAATLAAGGQEAEAMRALNEGIAKLGPVPSLHLKALELESASARWDPALTRIDALEKSAPRPEPWMAERAKLLARAGRDSESRAAWITLRDRLKALPNLDRGTPQNTQLLNESLKALGETAPASVIAPPASRKP